LSQASETGDPKIFVEASTLLDWDTTMNEEYLSLVVNDTCDLIPLLRGTELFKCKWLYRTNSALDGSVKKNKVQ
jgi:hypothetical protein